MQPLELFRYTQNQWLLRLALRWIGGVIKDRLQARDGGFVIEMTIRVEAID